MISTEELKDVLTQSFAEEVARDIANAFVTKANKDNLELEFRIPSGGGRMQGSLSTTNTWFKFDVEEDGPLKKSRDIIYEVFSEDFDLENKKELSKMKCREAIVGEFNDQVRVVLNSGMFHREISGSIRKNAMGGISEAIHPLDVIRFLEVEIGKADEDEFLLVIEKRAVADQVTGQFINPPDSVHQDLFKIYKETGKDFDEIIAEKHAEGDSRYDLVAGARKSRYSFDVHCEMAVDYSLGVSPEDERTNSS